MSVRRPTGRWVIAGLGLAVFLLFGLISLVFLVPMPVPKPLVRVNQAQFQRIAEGMTEAEVEDLLGGPPGDYTWGRTYVICDSMASYAMFDGEEVEEWRSDDAIIRVYFGPEGTMVRKKSEDFLWMPPPTIAERVKDWVKGR
jgi:hypothetical protein